MLTQVVPHPVDGSGGRREQRRQSAPPSAVESILQTVPRQSKRGSAVGTENSLKNDGLSGLNDRAYNVFLQFTDAQFDSLSYVAFKRSDNNVSANLVSFAALIVYTVFLFHSYGVHVDQPLYVAALISTVVSGVAFSLSTSAGIYLDVVRGGPSPLRRACELLDTTLCRAMHDTAIIFGQAATSLMMLGVCTSEGTLPLECLVLSMVFVLVAQVLFAKAGSSAGYVGAWAISVVCTNAALHLTHIPAAAWWVNATYVCLLVASYEGERQTLRHFIKSVLAVNLTQQFAELKVQVAEQSAEAKRAIARHIAHEVRGPLNTIAIAADILGQELETSPDVPKLVVDVVESLKDASAMAMEQIDEMMLFEKLSAGMRSVDPQAVAIVPYLRDCMKPHLIPALAKSIEFTLDVAGGDGNAVGENALAKIDPVKFKVVVRNLCSNAIKFTPEHGKVTIAVSLLGAAPGARPKEPRRDSAATASATIVVADVAAAPSTVRITVKDSGAGLSKANLKQLFTEGTQFRANELQGGGGSGLGLFITKGIVEQHVGGKIWCESAGEGHGCTFFVEMPVLDRSRLPPEMARWLGSVPSFSTLLGPTGPQRPPPTPLLHGAPGTHPPTSTAPTVPTAPAATPLGRQPEPPSLRGASLSLRHPLPPRLHVLVVDDSDMNRKMVARLLTREGHTVTEATDGVVAVSMVSQTLIDRTPTPEGAAPSAAPGGTRASHKAGPVHFDAVLMDGNMPRLNGAEACRQIKHLGYLGPVIALTGNDDTTDFQAAGADGALIKPINWPKLAATLSDAIRTCQEAALAQAQVRSVRVGGKASSRKMDARELLFRVRSCKKAGSASGASGASSASGPPSKRQRASADSDHGSPRGGHSLLPAQHGSGDRAAPPPPRNHNVHSTQKSDRFDTKHMSVSRQIRTPSDAIFI